MAWALVTGLTKYQTANGSERSSLVNPPGTVVSGNLLIAIVSTCLTTYVGLATVTPPTGWTSRIKQSDGGLSGVEVFSKIATGSEPSTYTWGYSGASDATIHILQFSGNSSSAVPNISGGNSTLQTTSTAHAAPIPVTTVDGCLILNVWTACDDSGTDDVLFTGQGTDTLVANTQS